MRAAVGVVGAMLLAAVSGSVIGIDLGSEFIKVATVRGGTGIDIVLNEQSKRKSNNYIGYRGDDRFLGEDAYNLAPRFPAQMYTFLNRVIGKPWSDEAARKLLTDDWALPYSFVENEERGTIDLRNPDPDVAYTMEELIAQLFGYIKQQAEDFTEGPVTEAVLAIPSFFDDRQRQALTDAANMTGLTLHGLMPHTTAAALQYGVQKRGFGNNTVNVVIYDMGGSRLEVGVYRFRPYTKTNLKVKAKDLLGAMDVLAVTSDESLGGRTFDVRVAKYLAKKFQEKEGIDLLADTSLAAKKAYTSLLRRASKAKEVLSANRVAQVQMEELYQGKPFFYQLKREELDAECADLFERSVPTVKKALEKAGVAVKDIDAFEIIGGGVRVPRLQSALSEALDGRNLDRTLNGDETIALGAAFQAAKLSGSFRTKGFFLDEALRTNITFQLSQVEGSDKVPKIRPLFVNGKPGTKKSITVAREKDFDVKIFSSEGEGDDAKHDLQMTVKLSGIGKILDDVGFNKKDKSENSTHSVALLVKLTDEGIIRVANGDVKFDDHVMVSRKVRVKEPKVNTTAANDTANETSGEEKKEEENKGEEKDGENKEEEKKEEKKEEEKKEDDKKEDEKKEEKKEKKEEKKYTFVNKTEVKKYRRAATVEIVYERPLPMNGADYTKSLEVLKKLQAIEDKKKEAARAKNALETYLYWVKYEGILDHEPMAEFVSEEDTARITEAVNKCNEWMEEGEGSEDSTGASAFKEQHALVEAAVQPVLDKQKAKLEEAALKIKKEKAEKKEKEEAAKKEAEKEAEKAEEKGEEKEEEKAEEKTEEKAEEKAEEKTEEGEEKPAEEKKPDEL